MLFISASGGAAHRFDLLRCACIYTDCPSISRPSATQHPNMSPVAVHHKSRVYSLHPLDGEVRELAERLFEYSQPGEKGFENWRDNADGIMVRGSAVTEDDVARFGPQLRFIAKHGVGVDRLAMPALKAKGVVVMNTAGVNVSRRQRLS